jgi:hypothetical protein
MLMTEQSLRYFIHRTSQQKVQLTLINNKGGWGGHCGYYGTIDSPPFYSYTWVHFLYNAFVMDISKVVEVSL